MNAITETYRKIYETERQTSTIKEGYIPGMWNRITTDGVHGIWGHVIGDLVLTKVIVNETTGIITLGVDS